MFLRTACSTLVVSLCAVACQDSAEAPLGGFATNPTPYQSVLLMISDGGRLPAPGDDFTLYLGRRFEGELPDGPPRR
jgi:hypothetical protein